MATLDGRLRAADEPLIHPDDVGLLRGDGIFETTLVVDGRPRDLTEHLARFAVSAQLLGLALPDASEWRRGIDAVLAGWTGGREMVLRLICTRGREGGGPPTAFVLGGEPSAHLAHERRDGVRVLLLERGFAGTEIARMPWLLPGAKTLSYAINMAAKRHAEANGADDIIFVGTDGQILEGPTATVVLARTDRTPKTLVTTPTDGILAGVTVRRLFRDAAAAGWQTSVEPLRPADLTAADGCWLVSGVRLLAPVVAIDGSVLPRGTAHDALGALLQVP